LWNRAARTDLATWVDPPFTVSAPWKSAAVYEGSWIPVLHGADHEFIESYASAQRYIDVYSALYSGPGFQLVDAYNRVANPKSWTTMSENFEFENINGARTKVRRTRLASRMTSRSVWTWYSVAGEYTSSPERVKYLAAKARLLGTSPSSVVYVLSIESAQDDSRAEEILRDFLAHASFLR
jgi:EpsI family protein